MREERDCPRAHGVAVRPFTRHAVRPEGRLSGTPRSWELDDLPIALDRLIRDTRREPTEGETDLTGIVKPGALLKRPRSVNMVVPGGGPRTGIEHGVQDGANGLMGSRSESGTNRLDRTLRRPPGMTHRAGAAGGRSRGS